jgi:protein-S-isoprenylcysteine O-methyltransferase Ste14
MRQRSLRPGSDTPNVIAHPPLIYGAGFLIGYALDEWLGLSFGIGRAVALGWIFVAGGLGLALWAVWHFRRAGTHVSTSKSAITLVTDGPYIVSRNPIYVALTLVYFGVASLCDAPIALAVLFPVLMAMHLGVVLREEAHLERRFGEAYRAYAARTKRYV